jgi:hypothetical protein
MSNNKYMAFSMQIFLIFLLIIVGIIISTKLLTLRVSTFILTCSHLLIIFNKDYLQNIIEMH